MEPMTPAKMPLVDCDVHPLIKDIRALMPYLSSSWQQHFKLGLARSKSDNGFIFARARDRYSHPNATYRLDALPDAGGPAGSDPAFTLKHHVEPNDITTALLLPQEHYGVARFGDSAAAAVFERANNEYLIDTWLGHDKRFALAMSVSEHDPKAAADDIRRLGNMPGVVGVQLLLLERMAGSAWFDPIYEAACDMNLPIVSHQNGSEGCYTHSQGPAGGIPRSYGERHAVLPQIGAANVLDLIVSGTFERFPKLRVVMVEWGFTWLSWLMARMDYLWEADRAAAPRIKRRPSEYVIEHFTFATQPLDETTRPAEMAAMFGVKDLDKLLLFASDYPHYDTDAPNVVLNKIPAEMKSRVCYENAVRAFGPNILRSLQ